MRTIGEARGASVASIALVWLLARPHVTTIIIGARTEAQLRENLAATDLALDPAELAELDRVSALPVEYPAWAIARLTSLGRAPTGAR